MARDELLVFDLHWLSGTHIGRFCASEYWCCRARNECVEHALKHAGDDVDRFLQNCDEGLVDGVPEARSTTEGYPLESYRLIYNGTELGCGAKFSERILPNSTLHLVLVLIQHAAHGETA